MRELPPKRIVDCCGAVMGTAHGRELLAYLLDLTGVVTPDSLKPGFDNAALAYYNSGWADFGKYLLDLMLRASQSDAVKVLTEAAVRQRIAAEEAEKDDGTSND